MPKSSRRNRPSKIARQIAKATAEKNHQFNTYFNQSTAKCARWSSVCDDEADAKEHELRTANKRTVRETPEEMPYLFRRTARRNTTVHETPFVFRRAGCDAVGQVSATVRQDAGKMIFDRNKLTGKARRAVEGMAIFNGKAYSRGGRGNGDTFATTIFGKGAGEFAPEGVQGRKGVIDNMCRRENVGPPSKYWSGRRNAVSEGAEKTTSGTSLAKRMVAGLPSSSHTGCVPVVAV